MRRNLTRFLKLILFVLVIVLLTIFLYKSFKEIHDDKGSQQQQQPNIVAAAIKRLRVNGNGHAENRAHVEQLHPKAGSFFMGHPKNVGRRKIDWNNYEFLVSERGRHGIGEHGAAGSVPSEQETERLRLYNQNGFNGLLSDMISLNRSVKDIRHKE